MDTTVDFQIALELARNFHLIYQSIFGLEFSRTTKTMNGSYRDQIIDTTSQKPYPVLTCAAF